MAASQLRLALLHVGVPLFLAPDHGSFGPLELGAKDFHLLERVSRSLLKVLRAPAHQNTTGRATESIGSRR